MKFALLLFSLLVSVNLFANAPADTCHEASSSLECFYLHYQSDQDFFALARSGKIYYRKNLQIRVGIQNPTGEIKGDVLYLHGFSDRLDNHAPLFHKFNQVGFRVISFDLPGHGENFGKGNDINQWNFTELAELAAFVEKQVTEKTGISPKTFVLAGWSTGGLLAVRIAQKISPRFNRPISGLILYAPGIAVRKPWNIGERTSDYMMGLVGRVTLQSLTHDRHPPHNGPIFPLSPVVNLAFGVDLNYNALLARNLEFPAIPTLLFVGDVKEDLYADSAKIKIWARKQQQQGKELHEVSCEEGRHELDNEIYPMGALVRTVSSAFARSISNPSSSSINFDQITCHF